MGKIGKMIKDDVGDCFMDSYVWVIVMENVSWFFIVDVEIIIFFVVFVLIWF